MCRYWFILSDRKLSLILFRWPYGLTGLTTLEGQLDRNAWSHGIWGWLHIALVLYLSKLERSQDDRTAKLWVYSSDTQRLLDLQWAQFKDEEVMFSVQTLTPALVKLRQEDCEFKATVRICLKDSKVTTAKGRQHLYCFISKVVICYNWTKTSQSKITLQWKQLASDFRIKHRIVLKWIIDFCTSLLKSFE